MTVAAERRAALGLSLLAKPTYEVAVAVARAGLVETWERRRVAALSAGRVFADPAQLLELGIERGARFVVPGDEEWPAHVDDLNANLDPAPSAEVRRAGRDHGAPFGLWVRGRGSLAEVAVRSVALVGARAATGYGEWVAGELAVGLAEREATVISGGAFGIDAAAHRGALAGAGVTVAVLPGGIDVVYPKAHDQLFERVTSAGLLVAEQPPGTRPRRDGFLTRNRLIAALAGGVVLVEAGLRSGARNTFAHAAALGRARMVVPGPVTSALSAGCHLALRLDPEARVVTRAAEVLEEIGSIGADLADVPQGPSGERDALGADARAVLDAIPGRATWTGGRVAAEIGVPLARVLGLASALVDCGLLEPDGEGFRLTEQARAPTRR